MKTTFTYLEMVLRQGCYKNEPGKLDSLMTGAQQVTLSEILMWNIPVKDKAWFLCYSCELTQAELISFATKCAKSVLQLFESKYSGNSEPKLVVETAKDWLMKECLKTSDETDADVNHIVAVFAAFSSDTSHIAISKTEVFVAALAADISNTLPGIIQEMVDNTF